MITILFLSGCGLHTPVVTQTYKGDALPDDQEVMLWHQFGFYNDVIVIDNVIYANSKEYPKYEYRLKPGVHRIDYYLNVYGRGWGIGGFTIDMKAGHTYVLNNNVDTNFHILSLFSPRTWETTVILRDKTDQEDVRIKHFTNLIPWDQDIEKLYEKYSE
jgi:hypothetical protein